MSYHPTFHLSSSDNKEQETSHNNLQKLPANAATYTIFDGELTTEELERFLNGLHEGQFTQTIQSGLLLQKHTKHTTPLEEYADLLEKETEGAIENHYVGVSMNGDGKVKITVEGTGWSFGSTPWRFSHRISGTVDKYWGTEAQQYLES